MWFKNTNCIGGPLNQLLEQIRRGGGRGGEVTEEQSSRAGFQNSGSIWQPSNRPKGIYKVEQPNRRVEKPMESQADLWGHYRVWGGSSKMNEIGVEIEFPHLVTLKWKANLNNWQNYAPIQERFAWTTLPTAENPGPHTVCCPRPIWAPELGPEQWQTWACGRVCAYSVLRNQGIWQWQNTPATQLSRVETNPHSRSCCNPASWVSDVITQRQGCKRSPRSLWPRRQCAGARTAYHRLSCTSRPSGIRWGRPAAPGTAEGVPTCFRLAACWSWLRSGRRYTSRDGGGRFRDWCPCPSWARRRSAPGWTLCIRADTGARRLPPNLDSPRWEDPLPQ